MVVIDPVMVRVLRSAVGTGTPHSVSVAAGDELTRGSSGAFLEEALRAVPGIQIQNRFNLSVGERVAIRGFGSRAQFGVRGIRVLVDGIPATLPDGQATIDHLDLSGLGRVEILRGPSAALYGNAAGGVLHFRTLDPAVGAPEVTARSVGGSNGLLTLEGSVSGRSGSTGYRIGYSRMEFDGFRRDPVADDGSAYGAGTRRVINGQVSLPLAGGDLRVVANGLDLAAENPGSLSETLLAEGQRSAFGFNVRSATRKDVLQGQAGATWTGPMGGLEAEFAAWGIRRELDNPIPGRVIDLDRNAGGARALFRSQHDITLGELSVGAGVEGEFQRDDRFNYRNESGARGALLLSQLERVRAGGFFVQTRLDLESGVSFLAGLRYDGIRFSVGDRFVTADNPDDSGSRDMDALSPSFGFVVPATSTLEFFGSLARSFETPTTTELANRPSGAGGFNPLLEPQLGFTVEGGMRGRLGANATFEVTAFQSQLDDELVAFEVPSDPGRSYFENAGSSLHRGWEVAADTRLGERASFRVAYTHVAARFEDFVSDDDDFSGNAIPGLAPNRLDALFTATAGNGFFELRGLYQDDVPVDNGGAFFSESWVVVDARAGLQGVTLGTLDLEPFAAISNVFDRTYNSSVVVNAFGSRYFEPGPGRTFRFGLGVTWGS